MSLPRRNVKEELLYFCHKHPTITDTCKTALVLLSTPICCCICCCCWVGYCGRGDGCVKGKYEKQKQARMDIVHWGRKAHALKRRKSLSIGTSTTLVAKVQRKHVADQAACPLFAKMPMEIREMIYQFALTDAGAVDWALRRDWHHRFTVPRASSCLPISGDPAEIEYRCQHAKPGASGCALLRTCRRIYTEAIPILYSITQFHFDDGDALHAFAAITPTSRLKNIRTLRIDLGTGLGDKTCRAIIRLKCWDNLRVMYIANKWPIADEYDPYESIVAEAESLKHCVFYFLMYENDYFVRSPNVVRTGPRKLLSYKYVDPKADPGWRNVEWRNVEEV